MTRKTRLVTKCLWRCLAVSLLTLLFVVTYPNREPSRASGTSLASTLAMNGKIAFTSDRDGNREIYVMNDDGTNQVRLTNNSVVDDRPTWSLMERRSPL